MTMPTPEKTWQFSPDIAIGGTGAYLTDFRQLMINIVKALTEMPINPWVVLGSSDGTNAAMDAVNRWKPAGVWDITKLVWLAAGSAHSWIVLRQAGLFSTCDLCIDLSNASPYNITVIWGSDGTWTGGTTLNRPTITTFNTIINNTIWSAYQSNTAFSAYLHVEQSTDGECTRVVGMWDGIPYMFWILDKVKNPVSGWANPVVVSLMSSTTVSVMTIAYLNDTARLVSRTASVATVLLFMTGEGYGSALIYENTQFLQPNQLSGDFQIYPIGLVSETTGAKGRHGELYDMWWGPPGTASGSPDGTWPDDSTKKYWSPDAVVLPWNGLVTTGVVPLVRY